MLRAEGMGSTVRLVDLLIVQTPPAVVVVCRRCTPVAGARITQAAGFKTAVEFGSKPWPFGFMRYGDTPGTRLTNVF